MQRVVRFHSDNLNAWIHLFEIATCACNRSTSADSRDKVRNCLPRLPVDFRTRGFIMGLRIHRVKILIRFEVASRVLFKDFSAQANGTIGTLEGIAMDYLGTVSVDNLLPFSADVGRDDQLD